MENKEIKLFTDGEVKTRDERKFTRLVGGFGDSKPMFTIFQASELLGLRTGDIKDNFERNEGNFEKEIDFIDLKSANVSNVSDTTIDIAKFLKKVGYSQNKLNATKRWLTFSLSGMMKLVKIATTKESWNIYDSFLEDYFKTKVENVVLKKSIDEELKFLKEQKASTLGKMFMEQDNSKKIELFNESEKINNRITELEKTKSEKETIKKYETELTIANDLLNSNNAYDIGKFSKILAIPHLGRNNFFEWMRNKGVLMSNNVPYQRYSEYFKVIPIQNNKFADSKTLLKANGIKYIINKLIKDGKVITKSVDEILSELEPEKVA